MILYRLVSGKYAGHDGTGAKLYGGRWNHKGTAVIYTAESRALCALEVLAGAGELAGDYVLFEIEVPDDVEIRAISRADLGADWDGPEPQDVTRNMGTQWAAELSSAVLSVPSAVIPDERNFIINPAHPDFARIRFRKRGPFRFDDRLRPRRS